MKINPSADSTERCAVDVYGCLIVDLAGFVWILTVFFYCSLADGLK